MTTQIISNTYMKIHENIGVVLCLSCNSFCAFESLMIIASHWNCAKLLGDESCSRSIESPFVPLCHCSDWHACFSWRGWMNMNEPMVTTFFCLFQPFVENNRHGWENLQVEKPCTSIIHALKRSKKRNCLEPTIETRGYQNFSSGIWDPSNKIKTAHPIG
jgi:hypothetical protein